MRLFLSALHHGGVDTGEATTAGGSAATRNQPENGCQLTLWCQQLRTLGVVDIAGGGERQSDDIVGVDTGLGVPSRRRHR